MLHRCCSNTHDAYTSYYLSTSGQRYWSDLGQLSVYIDDYHADLDRRLGSPHKGSEMITELYVPRPALSAFLAAVCADSRQQNVGLIYGTIRLIERDDESVLAWAREPWACTVMNLHVDHTPERIAKAADDFRRLIDRAIEFGGSYPLGQPEPSRGVPPAHDRVPAREAAARPSRNLPERLVSPLQAHVRRPALAPL